MEDFVFPASKIVLQSRKMNGEFPTEQAMPVCITPLTVIAAYDLLVALCTGCVPNLRVLSSMLIDMYYNGKLTHNQTTNFRLFQTVRVCRRQFHI